MACAVMAMDGRMMRNCSQIASAQKSTLICPRGRPGRVMQLTVPKARRQHCVALQGDGTGLNEATDVVIAKTKLSAAIGTSRRGASTTSPQRAVIQESLVESRGLTSSLELLEGTWELLYTTVPDVLNLISAQDYAFGLKVGTISQRFVPDGASSQEGGVQRGTLQNIVKLGVWPFLQAEDGVTVTVSAQYTLSSTSSTGRRLDVEFEQIQVGDVHISEALETLLAPAILPRSQLVLKVLLFFREFQLNLQLRELDHWFADDGSGRRKGNYLITFVDDDLLIGRIAQSSNVLVFRRSSTPE
eukprot:jgi/Mesvir1/14932/Mv05521-RA.2